jgi:hypothetical protein
MFPPHKANTALTHTDRKHANTSNVRMSLVLLDILLTMWSSGIENRISKNLRGFESLFCLFDNVNSLIHFISALRQFLSAFRFSSSQFSLLTLCKWLLVLPPVLHAESDRKQQHYPQAAKEHQQPEFMQFLISIPESSDSCTHYSFVQFNHILMYTNMLLLLSYFVCIST